MTDFPFDHPLAFIAMIFVATITVCFGGDILIARTTCYAQTAQIGFKADWGVWSDCRILVDDKWVPLNNYIMRDTVKQ